jgi:hypothetical protein
MQMILYYIAHLHAVFFNRPYLTRFQRVTQIRGLARLNRVRAFFDDARATLFFCDPVLQVDNWVREDGRKRGEERTDSCVIQMTRQGRRATAQYQYIIFEENKGGYGLGWE